MFAKHAGSCSHAALKNTSLCTRFIEIIYTSSDSSRPVYTIRYVLILIVLIPTQTASDSVTRRDFSVFRSKYYCSWCNVSQNFTVTRHLNSSGSHGFQILLVDTVLCTVKNWKIASVRITISYIYSTVYLVDWPLGFLFVCFYCPLDD